MRAGSLLSHRWGARQGGLGTLPSRSWVPPAHVGLSGSRSWPQGKGPGTPTHLCCGPGSGQLTGCAARPARVPIRTDGSPVGLTRIPFSFSFRSRNEPCQNYLLPWTCTASPLRGELGLLPFNFYLYALVMVEVGVDGWGR